MCLICYDKVGIKGKQFFLQSPSGFIIDNSDLQTIPMQLGKLFFFLCTAAFQNSQLIWKSSKTCKFLFPDTKLCGGIWGFGVFDNKDANKIEASKLFIKYMADSAEGTPDAVLSSTYFPVRDTVEGKDLTGLYGDVQTMSDYSTLMQYLGDYYQVTPGWAEARTAWWNMLQQVGSGADVQTAVDEFVGTANAAAGN